MEYKLSSFQFSNNIGREDKHLVIKRINSIRSKCPSDANFTGQFGLNNQIFKGDIRVLFSKGTFNVTATASNMAELMQGLLNALEDQIAVWKQVRFDQPHTFIDYSEWNRDQATGS